MQHQCFQLARLLSEREWEQFIAAALSGKNKWSPDMLPFLKAIKDEHPAFESPEPLMWQHAFAERPYNNARLRVLRTYLKEMLEDFLIQKQLEKAKTHRELLLLDAMLQRGSLPASGRLLASMQRARNTSPLNVAELELDLELEERCLDLSKRDVQAGNDFAWAGLLTKIQDVALAKRLLALTGYAGLKAFKVVEDTKMEAMIEETLLEVNAETEARQPFIAIHHHLLRLLLGKELPSSYHTVLHLLTTHARQMQSVERLNIYVSLVNHFVEQDRRRVPGSLQNAFETFQAMHRENLIFGMGSLTESAVRNILRIGTRLGEMDWTRAFMDEARERLPMATRGQMYHYGMAMLDYADQKFSEAKRHLVQLDFTSPAIRIYHDNLLMRICYETNDADGFETVSSVLLRHLFRKERIAESTKRGTINLAKAISMLFDFRGNPNPKMNLDSLKQYLAKLTPITHLDWIQVKLRELEDLHPRV